MPPATPSASVAVFVGNSDFEQICAAEASRSEDVGTADTVVRTFEGAAGKLTSFLANIKHHMPDPEYPNAGEVGYRVTDVPGDKRRVAIEFRGLISNVRDADIVDSSVFGTLSLTQDNGEAASVEFKCPQTEYRYVVLGNKPSVPAFTGVANASDRPIQIWNLQPYNIGTVSNLCVIERLNKFDVKPAGLAWEVAESWVREITMKINDNFTINSTALPNVEKIDPTES